MKTLTLVTTGYDKADPADLLRREAAGEHPRTMLFEQTLNADLLNLRYLERVPSWRRLVYRVFPVSVAQVLEAFLVKGKYDAVISWAENLGIPFALLLRLTGARTVHVAIFSWVSGRKKAPFLKLVHPRIDRMFLMSSVQRNFAVQTIGIPEHRAPLLRWPVDTVYWHPMDRPTNTICAVGREMRDYGTLIEAMRGLDIPCHIAAARFPGKRDAWLEDVERAGPLPPGLTIGKKSFPELRDLYAGSRFLVMPVLETETDNGATSILEAMAMGRPVICSRTQGQVDIIQDGKTGIFVPLRDPRALREAILALWNDPARARAMGEEGRRYVERYHRLEDWIAAIRLNIEEVMEERSRRFGPAS